MPTSWPRSLSDEFGGPGISPAQLGRLFAKTEPKFSTCGRSFAELAPGCFLLPIKAQPPRFLATSWEAANGRKHSYPLTLASFDNMKLWPLFWRHLDNFHPPFQGAPAPIGGGDQIYIYPQRPTVRLVLRIPIFDRCANLQILGGKICWESAKNPDRGGRQKTLGFCVGFCAALASTLGT